LSLRHWVVIEDPSVHMRQTDVSDLRAEVRYNLSAARMSVTGTALAFLGPVSSARQDGLPFLFILLALIAFLIVQNALRLRARTKQVREFAETRSLTYIGATVPATFPPEAARALRWAHSMRRAVVAANGSKDLILFDCTVGYGRGSRHRTVVAARGRHGAFGWAPCSPDLMTEEVGEWTLVYPSNRLMSLEEIEALVSEFSAPAQSAN
jgi:hypothetical protein